MLAHQPTEAATEREPYDTGIGNGTARCGESKRLRLVVQLPPDYSALGPHRSCSRIHASALHGRHVDHQAAVIGAVTGRAVAAAAN